MSTVAEIENAIAQLPPEQWMEIRDWMNAHPPSVEPASKTVEWSRSAAANRDRAEETRLPAEVVMETLANLR